MVMSDDDQVRYRQQAQLEGLSFSAWLRAAAQERLERMRSSRRFRSLDELSAFFALCNAGEDSHEPEPDWERHKAAIARSRQRGLPKT
ncbi:MAG: antitoxin [Gammaproteobacteria bacterium]|nr:antitoxin [Gammaproteobacteria bacterium]